MKNEMKCRALIRSILRDARANESTIVLVKCEGEQLDHAQRERDIIDAVFSVDESQLVFIDLYTQRTLGSISIVLEYDSLPSWLICDYSDNRYTENLIRKAESKI